MKNNRASHQTARQGWKPRKTSDKRLISDIVDSICAHSLAGIERSVSDYTTRPEIVAAVKALLAARCEQELIDLEYEHGGVTGLNAALCV